MNRMLLKAIIVVILGLVLYYHYNDEPLPADLRHDSSNVWFKLEKQATSLVVSAANILGFDTAKVSRWILEFVQSKRQYTDDLIQVEDAILDGIPVRIFAPKSSSSKLKSGIVYFHGGGWVVGSRDLHHTYTRSLALDTGAVVISVEYRRAPEHVFPAAYDDCLKVAHYFMKNYKQYGVDRTRIALAGESAGGNLAAAVTLGLRDSHPDLKPKLQILITPVTQCADFQLPSYQQNDKLTGFLLSTRLVVYYCLKYAVGSYDSGLFQEALQNGIARSLKREARFRDYLDTKHIPKYLFPTYYNETQGNPIADSNTVKKLLSQINNPYMSPLFAKNLQNLPEAYVMVAEYDVLRDDAILYIRRLKEAKVTVTEAYHKTVHGALIHSVPGFRPITLTAGDIPYKDLIKFIKLKL